MVVNVRLALTLSFSNSRFDERRAEAIDGPRAAEIGRLPERHAEIREDFAGAGRNSAHIGELARQTIWPRSSANSPIR
ncbi:MAG TPA: hypothetical protein VMU18_12790 [Rhodoblastus sp.]|nr:hypothetical protein [Rhodoblastus sp.]